MNELIVNPSKYRLSPEQIDHLASEYFGKCMCSSIDGDELAIEFEDILHFNLFKSLLAKYAI